MNANTCRDLEMCDNPQCMFTLAYDYRPPAGMQSTGLMNARNYQGSIMRKMGVAFWRYRAAGSYLPTRQRGSIDQLTRCLRAHIQCSHHPRVRRGGIPNTEVPPRHLVDSLLALVPFAPRSTRRTC